MSGNQKPEGFDIILYNPSEGDNLKAQVVVSHVGPAANWKLCVDASAQSRANANAKVANPYWICAVLRGGNIPLNGADVIYSACSDMQKP